MSRTTWVVITVVVIVLMAVVILPLAGLALFFRDEIGSALFGPGMPTSGTKLTYECEPLEGSAHPNFERLCGVIRERLEVEARHGRVVRPVGSDHIQVLLPAAENVDRLKWLVSTPGMLEFRIVVDRQEDRGKVDFERIVRRKEAGQACDDPRFEWCEVKQGWEWHTQGLLDAWNWVYVIDPETRAVEALVDVSDGQDVTGDDLARAAPSTQNGEPTIVFSLKAEAGDRMARLTRPEMRGRHLAIILDGIIQTAPVLQATLSSDGIIQGYGNIRERDEVLAILNSGCLGARLHLVAEEHFGPTPEAP